MNARLVGLSLSCILGLASCETGSEVAFPTAQTVAARVGNGWDADVATLARGRKIYTTSCTECHVARSIGQHSVAQWRHFINIMAPRARLQPDDQAALEAYVFAARKSLPPGQPENSTPSLR